MAVTGAVAQVSRWGGTVQTMSGTLDAVNDFVGGDIDLTAYQSVSVQIAGTGTIQFEVLNDSTGTWQSKALTPSGGGAPATNNGGSAGIFSGDLGANRFRARASAVTGSVVIQISAYPSSFSAPQSSGTISSITPGTASTSLGKAEDAAASSGDVGVMVLGVRTSSSPSAQTSASGDYSAFGVSSEGKLITAGRGAEETTWQNGQTLTNTAASTGIKGAAAAGVRNYLTDLVVSNEHSAAVRIQVLDGATALGAPILLPAGATVVVNFTTPLRGTAATALNVQLSAAVAGSVYVTASGYVGV